MSRFEISASPIVGVKILQRKQIGDERGRLQRLYCKNELSPFLEHRSIEQVNHTYTAKAGTVRGMHYQKAPFEETKVISCIRGMIYDVVVDLRKDSPSFCKWHAEILSAENCKSLLVPEGFAHGFQTLSDDSELIYLHTAQYEPQAEAGINPFAPNLEIYWPLEPTLVSERDRSHPNTPKN